MPLRTSLYRKPPSGRWSGRSSKRREVLSVNMISLPLADFRHVSHIGNDAHADSFGDLSFLKMGHSLLLQSSQSEQNLFLACSPPPKPPRLNLDEAEDPEDSPDWAAGRRSRVKKMSHSLPLLDSEDAAGEEEAVVEVVFPHIRANAGPQQSHSPGRGSLSSGRDGDSTATCPEDAAGRQEEEEEEDSSLSFSLDLGPSILDDVLQVMDKLHH